MNRFRILFVMTLLLTEGLSSKIRIKFDRALSGADFSDDAAVAKKIDKELALARSHIGDLSADVSANIPKVKDIANAQVQAVNSIYSIPGDNLRYFLAGAGFGAAAIPLDEVPILMAQASYLAGFQADLFGIDSIPLIDLKRMAFLFSFFSTSLDGDLIGEIKNVSLSGRYRLIDDPDGSFWANWHGFSLRSGLSYSYGMIKYYPEINGLSKTYPEHVLKFKGDAILGLETYTVTVPIEIESDVSFLYLFTFFAGAGLDVNIGSGENLSVGSGKINFEYRNTKQWKKIGDAEFDFTESATPQFLMPRIFGGLQLNLYKIKIITRVASVLFQDNYSASLAVRLHW